MWHCYREGAAPKIYPSKTTPPWWTTMRQDRGHPGVCRIGVWDYDAQENWWISSSWRRYCRTGCRRMWLSCRWCAFLVLCLFCKHCVGPVWGTLHQISAATAPPAKQELTINGAGVNSYTLKPMTAAFLQFPPLYAQKTSKTWYGLKPYFGCGPLPVTVANTGL